MNFSSQKDVCYFIDYAIWLLVANWVYEDASGA